MICLCKGLFQVAPDRATPPQGEIVMAVMDLGAQTSCWVECGKLRDGSRQKDGSIENDKT